MTNISFQIENSVAQQIEQNFSQKCDQVFQNIAPLLASPDLSPNDAIGLIQAESDIINKNYVTLNSAKDLRKCA